MKKLVSLLLVLVLVVSLAAPAMALTAEPKTKSRTNTFAGSQYTATVSASFSSANASLAYKKVANLSVQLVAHTYSSVLGDSGTDRIDSDVATDVDVSAYVTAGSGQHITEAIGYYIISGSSLTPLNVK